jgi:hypothetical protein
VHGQRAFLVCVLSHVYRSPIAAPSTRQPNRTGKGHATGRRAALGTALRTAPRLRPRASLRSRVAASSPCAGPSRSASNSHMPIVVRLNAAAGARDGRIQAYVRWQCPESLHIYARNDFDEYERWLKKKRRTNTFSVQAPNLPTIDSARDLTRVNKYIASRTDEQLEHPRRKAKPRATAAAPPPASARVSTPARRRQSSSPRRGPESARPKKKRKLRHEASTPRPKEQREGTTRPGHATSPRNAPAPAVAAGPRATPGPPPAAQPVALSRVSPIPPDVSDLSDHVTYHQRPSLRRAPTVRVVV